ncbi:phage head-tail adaptor, putative, SPP1 family [Kaistia soli DSM 19436]|uniref:Phage head-tail adaptor, putative, SPP1 family n=1 Tax=Kaistia soli DSM 19436 TaxID=1122133 RepID=A0A1M5PPM2_9HYPH|nr:phage head closure protein [Kaistia soli]SHH03694.1 phage head-tail adaptor, putative, SPP1 family [Kaistia soli DSM 19436]
MTIRAGLLAHTIAIERSAVTVDDAGRPVTTWSAIATRRAELVERTIAEMQHDSGTLSESTLILRVRWLADLRREDQVVFAGEPYRVIKISEPERCVELELECRRIEP